MTEQPFVKQQIAPATAAEAAAWGGFLHVHATLLRMLDAEMQAAHGLSFSEFEVLIMIARSAERRMRMTDLSAAVMLTQSGVTRLVERLCAEGLLVRERSRGDRRAQYAVLTQLGLARVRAAYVTHLTGVRAYFLSRFSDLDLNVLAAFWERLVPGAAHRYSPTDVSWLDSPATSAGEPATALSVQVDIKS